jgi:hypothetical protein
MNRSNQVGVGEYGPSETQRFIESNCTDEKRKGFSKCYWVHGYPEHHGDGEGKKEC